MTKPSEVGVFHAKTHLSQLIARVQKGEHFVITHRGKAVAELKPIADSKTRLVRGCAANSEFRMAADFDAPLDDFEPYM